MSSTRIPSNNNINNAKSHRPLVVLLGWAGCTFRNLEPYQNLYERMGFAVVSWTSSAVMVVRATYGQGPLLTIPRAWPHGKSSTTAGSCMQDLAWQILSELGASDFPMIQFHVFSNGGCFLWEQVLRILHLADPVNDSTENNKNDDKINVPRPVRIQLDNIRSRIMGVVFDSCPVSEFRLLPGALGFFPLWQRIHVWLSTPYANFDQPSTQARIRQRSREFLNFLSKDSWNLPQLYLYAANDALAPRSAVDELVTYRQELYGTERIQSYCWSDSTHCAHLYRHPQDYRRKVSAFVGYCMRQALKPPISRL